MITGSSKNTSLLQVKMFDCALFSLLNITFIIITVSILLLFGMRITGWILFYALVFSTCTVYYLKRLDFKQMAGTIVVSLLMLMAFVYFSGCVFDNSWDGCAYHKTAVGLLKEGWNPVYQSSTAFNNLAQSIPYDASNPLKWAEAYPKATWYFAAAIYSLTGNIESGKAYTLIFMAIVFAIFYDYLSYKNMKKWKCILVSLLAALNPISAAQFQSYYVDGMVASLLMSLMMLFIAYFDDDYRRSKVEIFAAISCLIILGCNLKFSVLVFIGSYCVAFFVFNAIRHRQQKLKHETVRLFSFFAVTAVASVTAVGFAPYITNIIRYKNPLYGFSEIVGGQGIVASGAIEGLSSFQMFFASLFGRMSHGEYTSLDTLLKLPFTLKISELSYYNYLDTRLSGFGILFSGVFVLSTLILLVMLTVSLRKKKLSAAHGMAAVVIAMTLLEGMLLPGTFQARYIAQLYFIPLYAVILLFRASDRQKAQKTWKPNSATAILLSAIMLLNIAPWAVAMKNRFNASLDTAAALHYLERNALKDTTTVAIWLSDFSGINYNLRDFHIDFTLIPFDQTDETYHITYNGWLYYKINDLG